MSTCTFLFDYPFVDGNLYPKLLTAVLEIVQLHEETEFLFTNALSQSLCLAAVLEARQRHPQKRIRVTLVGRTSAAELLSATDYHTLPACAIDRILTPSSPVKSSRYLNAAHESLQMWAIDRSDHLICHYYKELNCRNRLYDYARNATLYFWDLTEPDTTAYIQQEITRLSPEEQTIVRAIQSGVKAGEIGTQLGLSAAAVCARHAKVVRKLRTAVQRRAPKPGLAADSSKPVTCSLFACDSSAVFKPEQLPALTQAVRYIIKRFHVYMFIVERSACDSPLVRAVVDLLKPNILADPDTKISVLAHCPPRNKKALHALEQQFVPPFFCVMPVDTKGKNEEEQTRRLATTLLLQSDFVICNGGGDRTHINDLLAPVNDAIPRTLKVLDIANPTEEIMG